MITYDNSLHCTEPPSNIDEVEIYPVDVENRKIQDHIDEEKIDNSFIDFETVRIRELVKWEESKS